MPKLRIGLAAGALAAFAASGLIANGASAQDMLTTLGLNNSAPTPDVSAPEAQTAAAASPAPVIPPAAVTPPAQANPPAPPAPAASAAQATPPAAPPPGAPGVPPGSPPVPPAQMLSRGQLEQLVAPIALYPDPLLGQVLMASTYPLEVVEAARWVGVPANRALSGEALTNALKAQHWDPSVMALVPFPRVLAVMNEKIQWTEDLGRAFVAQQSEVMAAVQDLRHQAMAAGSLKMTPQCHCVIKTEAGGIISILPAAPQLVCVPVYNPTVVYGRWPVPLYPPVVFPVPVGFVYAPGVWIGFPPPIQVAIFGPLWGWGWIDWPHGHIIIDGPRYALLGVGHPFFAGGVWVHDPAHGLVGHGGFAAARVGFVGAAAGAAVAHHYAGGHTVMRGAGHDPAFARGGHAAHSFAGHSAFHGARTGHMGGRSFHSAHFAARGGGHGGSGHGGGGHGGAFHH